MIKIFYFSGTGNTLWSAQKIAKQINGCELLNIGVESQKSEIKIEADAVVLLFPSYAYGAPLVVYRFIKRAVFKTPYMASFVTYGTSPGGTLGIIARILKRKGIKDLYFGRIPSVENYIPIFGPPKAETAERQLGLQKDATEEAARIINGRKTNRVNTFRPFSFFVWLLFSLALKIFYNWYRVNDDCNGCGICEKLCPVSAITMRNGRPVHSRKCEHCQGCLNWCPRQAINFGAMGPGTPRYHHPEIDITEISR